MLMINFKNHFIVNCQVEILSLVGHLADRMILQTVWLGNLKNNGPVLPAH